MVEVGLYKIFVYFGAIVHESTILLFSPPTCMTHPGAILLHDYYHSIRLPFRPPLCMLYTI